MIFSTGAAGRLIDFRLLHQPRENPCRSDTSLGFYEGPAGRLIFLPVARAQLSASLTE